MRKVMVLDKVIGDDGKLYMVDKTEAVFLSFGVDFEQHENGPANFSTAIVEHADGTVESMPVEYVRFLRPSIYGTF